MQACGGLTLLVGTHPHQTEDLLHSETELSHVVVDETSGIWTQFFVFVLAPINLTMLHPPMHEFPKCFSPDSMQEPHFQLATMQF